jgi:hypothetical protein
MEVREEPQSPRACGSFQRPNDSSGIGLKMSARKKIIGKTWGITGRNIELYSSAYRIADDNPKNYSAKIEHPAGDHPILHLSPTAWNLRQGQALTPTL